MAFLAPAQQLTGVNTSANIADSVAARIKDPLWFLVRQWQTGEFEAENGGRPSQLSIVAHEYPIDRLVRGEQREAIPADTPLDFLVEREDDDGASPLWKSEALHYDFAAEGEEFGLAATGYTGRNLDWYHFDVSRRGGGGEPPAPAEVRMVPTALTFRGAPHPRWWRFEDGDAYFDSPADAEPNILSTVLPELFFLDINNWYLAPLPQTAGTIREIERLSLVDGFGAVTVIGPAARADEEWTLFALAADTGRAVHAGALFVPGVAIDVLDNDEVEEVVFARDEEANLVWASERLVTLADGTQARNGDGHPVPTASPATDPRPVFRLRTDLAPWRIPYVPRFISLSATSGEIYLRRARTVEGASRAAPQYRSVVVGDSWRLDEAQVPRSGVRVRRTRRFARGSDGEGYFWIGRSRQTAPRTDAPGLDFDFLEEPSG